MKTLIKIFLLFATINLTAVLLPKQAAASPPVSVSFQVFYDNLSPYGTWISHSNYGYVWIPSAGVGFRPYASNGYWAYTDYGWTWVSYYPWGWAPFHYGRWYFDPIYGYVWMPDYAWGPAWVSWRYADGYYAWAPLEPGISFGVSYNNFYPAANRWTCVRYSDFGKTNINNYYVNQSNTANIIKNSTVIQNTQVSNGQTYIAGPPKTEVQKLSGRTIQPVAVKEISKPGMSVVNNTLQIYKPQIQKATGGAKPAPAKVTDIKEVKPIQQRTVSPQRKEVAPVKNNTIQQQPKQAPANLPSRNIEQKPRSINPQIKSDENRPQPRTVAPTERKQPALSPPVKRDEIQQRPVQPRNDNPPIKRSPEQPRPIKQPPPNLGGEQQQPRMNRPENVRPAEPPQNVSPPVQQPQQRINANPPSEPPRSNPNLGGEQQQRHMQAPPPQQRNMQAPPPQQRNMQQAPSPQPRMNMQPMQPHGNQQRGKP